MTYSQTAPDVPMNSPRGEQNIGNSASWTTWASWGAVSIAVASFMPLIHQTNADMFTEFQVKNGVSQISLIIGILVLGMTALARYRPEFRLSVAIISLVISLLILGLYSILAVAGVVGINENVGLGMSERLTWLPGPGMLFSGLGCAAVVLACLLAFRQRPGLLAAHR